MKQILFIDDENNSFKGETRLDIIKSLGVNVIALCSVKELKDILKKDDKFDLIILDIIMPAENFYSADETGDGSTTGLMVLKDIRKKYRTTPVIVYSISNKVNAELLHDYNVEKFLRKEPGNTYKLAKAIKQILDI